MNILRVVSLFFLFTFLPAGLFCGDLQFPDFVRFSRKLKDEYIKGYNSGRLVPIYQEPVIRGYSEGFQKGIHTMKSLNKLKED